MLRVSKERWLRKYDEINNLIYIERLNSTTIDFLQIPICKLYLKHTKISVCNLYSK